MRGFQVVLLLVFGGFTILAVLIFSGIIPVGKDSDDAAADIAVTMWGTIPEQTFKSIMIEGTVRGEQYDITYVEKDARDIENDLVNALASGKGPDLAILPHTLIEKQKDKLYTIPYSFIPERTFRDWFVAGSEIYLRSNDMVSLPLYVDPVVMYWNRDLFTREALVKPPSAWVELQLLPTKLTKRDDRGNITQSAVGMGGVNNVNHFKEILSAQMIQTGSPIVSRVSKQTGESVLVDSAFVELAATGKAHSALNYYTEFADPAKEKYSWNSAKSNSLDEFIAGRLAVYFGKASDLDIIETRNSHLDFDVSLFPQIADASAVRATYGDMYGLVILRNSPNASAATTVASELSFGLMAGVFSDILRLPPLRRDLLAVGSEDIYQSVFFESAIISRAWLDPNPTATKGIFREMVENVLIGKAGPETAVSNAAELIEELF